MECQAAKKRAQKLVNDGKRDAARAELDKVDSLADPPKHPPRLIVNDATVEALGEKLNENPNGVLLLRDELYGWLAKMQQEEYASDRAFYLECFNGNGRYTYDRIGRGTVAVDHCILSIIGGIQPARIARLVRGTTKGTDESVAAFPTRRAPRPRAVLAMGGSTTLPSGQGQVSKGLLPASHPARATRG